MTRLTQWITVIAGIVSSLVVSACSRVSENERKYDPTAEQVLSDDSAAAKEKDMSSNQNADDSISIKDYPKDEEPQEIYGPPEMFGGPADEPDIHSYPPEPELKPIYGPPEMLQPPLTEPPTNQDDQARQIKDSDLKPELQDEPSANEKMNNYKKLNNNQKKIIYGPPSSMKKKPVVINSDAKRGSNVDPKDEEHIDEHGNIIIPKTGPGEIRALYGVVPPSANIKK